MNPEAPFDDESSSRRETTQSIFRGWLQIAVALAVVLALAVLAVWLVLWYTGG